MMTIAPGDYVLGLWAAQGVMTSTAFHDEIGRGTHWMIVVVKRADRWVMQGRFRFFRDEADPSKDRKEFFDGGPRAAHVADDEMLAEVRAVAERVSRQLGAARYEEVLWRCRFTAGRHDLAALTEAFGKLNGATVIDLPGAIAGRATGRRGTRTDGAHG